jgi:hypothetical protein
VPERLGASRTLRHSVDAVRGILRVRTWSLARHLLPDSSATPEPSDTRMARANAAEKEWFKEHGTKLDWIKHKAEGRWSEESSDSNSEPQPPRWPLAFLAYQSRLLPINHLL